MRLRSFLSACSFTPSLGERLVPVPGPAPSCPGSAGMSALRGPPLIPLQDRVCDASPTRPVGAHEGPSCLFGVTQVIFFPKWITPVLHCGDTPIHELCSPLAALPHLSQPHLFLRLGEGSPQRLPEVSSSLAHPTAFIKTEGQPLGSEGPVHAHYAE